MRDVEFFEKLVRAILDTHRIRDVDGFYFDSLHYFVENKAWSVADIVTTAKPECMFELRAAVSPEITTIQDVGRIQREIWSEICYCAFQATATMQYATFTELRFVTVAVSDGYAITGRMLAGGKHYENLVRKYNSRRDGLWKPLGIGEEQVDFDQIEPILKQ